MHWKKRISAQGPYGSAKGEEASLSGKLEEFVVPGQNNKISVYLDGNQVGTLAETTDNRVSFIYTAD